MARGFPIGSDMVFTPGVELVNAKFQELATLPVNPVRGQLVQLTVGNDSKLYYYDGSTWICGATSVNGRQGAVVLSKTDVGLSNVDNLKQQPWSQSLTEISADLDDPPPSEMISGSTFGSSMEGEEQLRGHHAGAHFLQRGGDGRYRWIHDISKENVPSVLDLNPAVGASNYDIIQKRPLLNSSGDPVGSIWVNRTPAQYKVDLQLNNVSNTSDVDKPVSTAQAAANVQDRMRANHTGAQLASTISNFNSSVDSRIDLQKGIYGGLATLDVNGKLLSTQIPALSITSTNVVNSQTAHLALSSTTQEGDVVVRTDLPATFIKNSGTTGTMTDWVQLSTPTDLVLSVNGKTGVVVISKADVGLSNVDNTSDLNKPVSTATSAAIAAAIAARRFNIVLPAITNNGSYVVTHNLGTYDVICGFQDATTKEAARMNWRATSVNTVTVYTDVSIAANTVRMVIQA